jgi:hypothetical protein
VRRIASSKVLYLLEDSKVTRKLIGKYIDVYEYPDGRIELRADGSALPYTTYDRLSFPLSRLRALSPPKNKKRKPQNPAILFGADNDI